MSPAGVRRAVWPALAALVLVGLLFLAVFPTRAYLAQRGERRATDDQVRVLDVQNRRLQQRIAQLRTDAEVERLARQDYNLVHPGEEVFAILPRTAAPKHR